MEILTLGNRTILRSIRRIADNNKIVLPLLLIDCIVLLPTKLHQSQALDAVIGVAARSVH